MIILEDKYRIPSAEEINSLVKVISTIKVGIENSKKIYHKDIFVIESLITNTEKKLAPRKRTREPGFPVNTFLLAMESFASAVNNLDVHEVNRCRQDIEFISAWASKNPPGSKIMIGS